MNKYFGIPAIAAAVICLSSCQKLGFFIHSDRIGVNVVCNGTKSLITTASIKTEGFIMAAYAEDEWHDNEKADAEDGSILHPNSAGPYFTKPVTFNDEKWTIDGEPKWINDVPLTFWCWNRNAAFPEGGIPSYTAGSDPAVLSFGYVLNAPSASDDLVFAYNSETRKFNDNGDIVTSESSGSRTDDKVDVHFFHALSEVNFVICVDSADDSFDPSLVIKSIALKNVANQGSCVLTGSKCTSDTCTEAFSWDCSSASPANYSQQFGPQTGTGSTWVDKTYSGKSYRKTGSSFFMIPQTLAGGNAEIQIVLQDDTTREATITDTWRPGEYYTYKLSAHASVIGFTVTLVDWGEGGTQTFSDGTWN